MHEFHATTVISVRRHGVVAIIAGQEFQWVFGAVKRTGSAAGVWFDWSKSQRRVGTYYFYARLGLVGTYTGLILAHAALGAPFVFLTVAATLASFVFTFKVMHGLG